ncbi:hypothetical protein [Bartonella sp. CL71SXKL]|uniref:hypothetical protein n=1 Tax=Bartonella sp. CL71SXKL TaxID=3243540 RepID=UPI0035D027CF
MQEGGADACEGVVHAGVSCWSALCWGACGCPCVGKTAFVMRAKWSMLTRFAV